MSDRAFCTIITASHLHWALALANSIHRSEPGVVLVVLVVDPENIPTERSVPRNVRILPLDKMRRWDLGDRIRERYAQRSDALRWSLKPVLMIDLLEEFSKVIYLDWDLHFFNDHRFVWDELDRYDVLLSPHWRTSRVSIDRPNFDLLLVGGLFNAGFVGVFRGGVKAMLNWGENCFDLCEKDFTRAMCDDQHYLNLLPVYFERVGVLRHKGCNLANWNMVECERTQGEDGEVLINDKEQVIFIHFTRSTIMGILSGVDGFLLPHLRQLHEVLERYKPGFGLIHVYEQKLKERQQKISPLRLFLGAVKRSVQGAWK